MVVASAAAAAAADEVSVRLKQCCAALNWYLAEIGASKIAARSKQSCDMEVARFQQISCIGRHALLSLQHCCGSLDVVCVHWKIIHAFSLVCVSEALAAAGPGLLVCPAIGVTVLCFGCLGVLVPAVAVDSYRFERPAADLAVGGC